MEPIIDINIAVYNQALYLNKTLDSVLEQQTSYKYRLIIGDDFSTDGSVDILKEYEKKYPDKITVIYQPENLGLNSAERNGIILLKNSTAKYIALLDGDDYWTDVNKLHQQIEFLETHPDHVGCFHNTEERYEDDEKSSFLYCNFPFARNISFNDLSYINFIPTCSVVFRNNLFQALPEWYKKLKMGDWPLHLLNAQYGDYWYMPKVMAVHRLHTKSTWMLQDAERNRQFTIDAYDEMINGFKNEKYTTYLKEARQVFINASQPINQKPGFKRRVKNFMISVIEKF